LPEGLSPVIPGDDPLSELLAEGLPPEPRISISASPERMLVTPELFPDESMYRLDSQLKELKESLDRIKFYLMDMDDLLPK
jgi:hypothetical protein